MENQTETRRDEDEPCPPQKGKKLEYGAKKDEGQEQRACPDIGEDPDGDDRIREAHWETFPASDPPSFTPQKS